MRDQHRIEQRAGKAGKGQAMPSPAQAGQDSAARIANEINDQLKALATDVA
jgi:hypothetical protein